MKHTRIVKLISLLFVIVSVLGITTPALADYLGPDRTRTKSHVETYDWRGLVVHGSPMHDLTTLEPIRKSRDVTEFGNRTQIFCSPDAIWAMWFAILDKDKFSLTNNACVRIGSGAHREKYYHFALPRNKKEDEPFTAGMIYICRAESFPSRRVIPILQFLGGEVEEWGSEQPVQPLAKITVAPSDFPFLNQVQFAKR